MTTRETDEPLKDDTGPQQAGVSPSTALSDPAQLDTLPIEQHAARVLCLPWSTRMDVILRSSRARELIQALPPEEVFWMVRQRGVEDCLPLIARTSHEQFQYLIDLDCWKRDQLDPAACLSWYRMLGRCNQAKVLEWFAQADDSLLVAALKQYVRVYKIQEETDISEEYDAMPPCTADGVNFFRFVSEDARLVLLPLLTTLMNHDAGRYRSLIEGIIWDARVEAEDEALRWRQSRIAEYGFPLFDDALAIYEPLSEPELRRMKPAAPEYPPVDRCAGHFPLRYAIADSMLPGFLRRTLEADEACDVPDAFEQYFVATANRVMVADGLEVNELDDVRRALRKTAGCVSIGLEHLSGGNPAAARTLLARHHTQLLFRCGHGLIAAASGILRRHRGRIWIADAGRFIAFYGTPLADTALGLVRSRPQFYEGLVDEGGTGYRDFQSLHEVEAARDTANLLVAADCLLFERAGLDPDSIADACLACGALEDPAELSAQALLASMLIAGSLELDWRLPLLAPADLHAFALRTAAAADGDMERGLGLFCGQAAAWLQSAVGPGIVDDGLLKDLASRCLAPLGDLLEASRDAPPDARFAAAVLVKRT